MHHNTLEAVYQAELLARHLNMAAHDTCVYLPHIK